MVLSERNVITGLSIVMLLTGCEGEPPAHLGVKDGQLAPCPDSPNCVSSQSTDENHTIAPLMYSGSPDSARLHLKTLIQSQSHTKLVSENNGYLHVEFKIRLFGFVDDVEFYFDEDNKVVHVRSASRLGYWDLGVNRRRVEKIRSKWKNFQPQNNTENARNK
jgi:uncharacterized protein (DUF1499 family)